MTKILDADYDSLRKKVLIESKESICMVALHEKDGKICRMKNITEKPSGSFLGGFYGRR
jgi:hypothetical protein